MCHDRRHVESLCRDSSCAMCVVCRKRDAARHQGARLRGDAMPFYKSCLRWNVASARRQRPRRVDSSLISRVNPRFPADPRSSSDASRRLHQFLHACSGLWSMFLSFVTVVAVPFATFIEMKLCWIVEKVRNKVQEKYLRNVCAFS